MQEEDAGTGTNRTDRCINEVPELEPRGFDHASACHYPNQREIISTVDVSEAEVPGTRP